MTELSMILERFRKESRVDFVGVWQIFKAVAERPEANVELAKDVESAISELLQDDAMEIGQFDQQKIFHPWAGSITTRLDRLHKELISLGRTPDIGEIAWLRHR